MDDDTALGLSTAQLSPAAVVSDIKAPTVCEGLRGKFI